MRQDESHRSGNLFRRSAMRQHGERLFGSVTVILPPSGLLASAFAVLVLLLLGTVTWVVEIPKRVIGVGILMPPDGVLDIVAMSAGRIAAVHVNEGQLIGDEDVLLDITSPSSRSAGDQLRILRSELALLDEVQMRQLAVDRERLLALDERQVAIARRLLVAKEEFHLQESQLELLQRRLERRRDLVASGSLSADMLDQEQGAVLQARSRLTVLRQNILGFEQEKAALVRERNYTEQQAASRAVRHRLEKHRLDRRIIEHQQRVARKIRASEAGVVARINVQPGAMVKAGDVLLKIFRPYRELEAWLYVPSATTGSLKTGQAVKLRFDAYPHQVYGTTDAVVTNVSSVAIVPWELKIPLALGGPVFEVRARIDRAQLEAFVATWPLVPGTVVKADIEQRRYSLFEWLLRRIAGSEDERRA